MFTDQLGTLTDRELEALCVPLRECLSTKTGPVDLTVLSNLDARRFDQAPVYDAEKGHLLGIVETTFLRELYEAREPLAADDPAVCNDTHMFHIGCFVSIDQILEKMSERRAVFVIRGSSATEHGYVEWNYGLLTISDLNRQPLRAALYALLAELESGMAVLVDSAFSDPWAWVKTLAEEHQVRILGYCELTRRRNLDVGPIAATTLAQLIQVVSKNQELLQKLGYRSRTEYDRQTGSIPNLRNCVMHPVRPLVLGQEDVKLIRSTVASVQDLYSRVQKLTARGPCEGMRTA